MCKDFIIKITENLDVINEIIMMSVLMAFYFFIWPLRGFIDIKIIISTSIASCFLIWCFKEYLETQFYRNQAKKIIEIIDAELKKPKNRSKELVDSLVELYERIRR